MPGPPRDPYLTSYSQWCALCPEEALHDQCKLLAPEELGLKHDRYSLSMLDRRTHRTMKMVFLGTHIEKSLPRNRGLHKRRGTQWAMLTLD